MQRMLCAQTCFASMVILSRPDIPPSTTSIIRPRLPDPVYTNSCENAWIATLIRRTCSSGAYGRISEG